ncbi:MAG TPA: metalloprotease TldD [Gammaproteobacteria bacterium]|nr:metalloprotease TldD [Gammaproteobacteria bacterium]HQZ88118.1 metalloprotease TldD [Gammaproteobacteria bacterium]HRA43347.1 metalloprotease TldD [Gammaproteobacteria bacterium]
MSVDQHHLEIARGLLLEPAGLSEQALQRVLDNVLGNAVDHADLYFQNSRQESWVLEDGIIKAGNYNIDYGVGVRAMTGEKTGFAYSDDIILPALEQAAMTAKTIAGIGGQNRIQAWHKAPVAQSLYGIDNPLESMIDAEKITLLRLLDAEARKMDTRVQQVVVSLSGVHDVILIVASDGTFSADVRPLVRLNVSVIVEEKGRREQASHGGGGRFNYARFLDADLGLNYAREAVRQALVNLEAEPAPAGMMPVVLGPGWPGILLHEAIGHGLEGDFNRKGSSAFAGRIGERVASPLCTVVDDGTIMGRRGSLNVDDEGTPSQCTTLIENGILKGYLQDKLNARLMGSQSTGNGRRESYAHLTIPRMTNTYLHAGNHFPEEIIKSVEKGLYAVNFGGGQVDITSGKFVFSASEAYLIENGKITRPVKGATLIGSGPEILKQVSMVGNDLQLDQGVGTCGKDGQSVPVGVGQPTLKIDLLTVGGTQQ